jgi:hypothetical protein
VDSVGPSRLVLGTTVQVYTSYIKAIMNNVNQNEIS